MPTKVPDIRALIEMLEAAGVSGGDFYLSTPITTGRELLSRAVALGVSTTALASEYPEIWADIKSKNEEVAAILAAELRRQLNPTGKMVVNPAAIRQKWTQSSYDDLWRSVIGHFSLNVVLTPGWEYSRGARTEVAYALSQGLPIFTHTLKAARLEDLRALDLEMHENLRVEGWQHPGVILFDGHEG